MKRDLNELHYLLDRIAPRYAQPEILAEDHGDEYPLYFELYEKVIDLKNVLEYMNKVIKYTANLSLNDNGRYEAASGDYYTSGSTIEFYWEEKWNVSRVESRNGEYYIYSYKEVPLDNLLVRVR